MAKECYDHLGNRYNSIEAMCRAYGTNGTTFNRRIKRKMSVEEALTMERVKGRKKECIDHLGNRYKTVKDMVSAYGITTDTFYRRIKIGKTLEEALTTSKRNVCTDHLGNQYENKIVMCETYGVNVITFSTRIKKGKTLKEALITNRHNRTWSRNPIKVDHLGNRYNSFGNMCDYYNISSSTVYRRLEKGFTLEDTLTLPVLKYNITRSYIGIDGKQYYKIKTPNKTYYLNAQQIIEYTDKGIFERRRSKE